MSCSSGSATTPTCPLCAQRRSALLLAQGLRNAEIAQRLVVTPKTIDHHVSSILRKLGATSRGQAGAAAARRGVVAGDAEAESSAK